MFFLLMFFYNFGVNSLDKIFFMKAKHAEVLCNFSVTALILLQTTVTRFGNILIINKFAILRNSKS